MERLYYIEDYSDEIMPCDCTLQGWANWLSKPDPQWSRDEAAADRATFKATPMRFEDDIVATYEDDGWVFSREVTGASLIAVRFGKGFGWDADSIVCDMDGLREFLIESVAYGGGEHGQTEYVAVGFDEPEVTLTYLADPPRMIVAGTIQ